MSYILGVDPGTISGYCIFGGPEARPLEWGQTGKKGKRTTGKEIADVIFDIAADYRPLVLAVEGQFLKDESGKGQADRYKAVSTLQTARIRGMWEGMAESDGCALFAPDGVSVNVWRSAVWGGRWRTEQAKRHAVRMAEITWSISLPNNQHHTAEACWIAAYAWGELAAKARQGRLL